MKRRRGRWVVAWFGLAGLAAGCHHGAHPGPPPDPAGDLARARAAFRHGDFGHALALFRRLTAELSPASPELAEVHYDLAECTFQSGDYVEAAHDFRQLADQYPLSEYAPLALLRAGDANLRMWRRPELDPSNGEAALAIYQELSGRYPNSVAAPRAAAHVQQLREWFAQKDYANGMFYFRRKAYDSAIIYFKDVIASYTGTRYVPLALLRLVDTYRAIGYAEERQETCTNLWQFYPKTAGLAKSCPPAAGRAPPS